MNKTELCGILDQQGIDPDSYDLNGGLLPEKYILEEQAGKWSVYYSERGLQTGKRIFATEAQACLYLLDKLQSDPTTRA